MEDALIHELTAAYALDALDPEQEREYEAHLGRCSHCQEELADLGAVTGSLAYAVPPAELPAGLRRRVLAAARAERAPEVSRRPRWAYPALGVAAVASCAAVALAVWVVGFQAQRAQVMRAVPLRGAAGSLVVGSDGSALLVVSGLARPPAGKTYEVWVMRAGRQPLPAGLFTSQDRTARVRLIRRVGSGAFVGVTLERAGGAVRPSGAPLFTSALA
ncbi:MAG: anti-sigma factor domain-containing protein [Burkholderiales bacterium]